MKDAFVQCFFATLSIPVFYLAITNYPLATSFYLATTLLEF
jgi:hypothetical protein